VRPRPPATTSPAVPSATAPTTTVGPEKSPVATSVAATAVASVVPARELVDAWLSGPAHNVFDLNGSSLAAGNTTTPLAPAALVQGTLPPSWPLEVPAILGEEVIAPPLRPAGGSAVVTPQSTLARGRASATTTGPAPDERSDAPAGGGRVGERRRNSVVGLGFGSPLGRFAITRSGGVLLGGADDGEASVNLVVPASLVAAAALIGAAAVLGQRRVERRRRILR
jgi:hypothetical protein